MYFEITSEITGIEIIAVGSSVCEIARLRKQFGAGCWRKLKGVATVRLVNGRIRAEDGYLRVIDESGEDYLYPQDYFVPIELPQAAEKALLSAA